MWPYRILLRDDDDIASDLRSIVDHFAARERSFDVTVFIPNAGIYLSDRFRNVVDGTVDIRFVTVRRASTVSPPGRIQSFVFRHRVLADVMRHAELLARRIRHRMGRTQRMVTDLDLDFDPRDKRILVIDDAVDTGTTMRTVKQMLLDRGASAVTMACISNLAPETEPADFAVYRYRLLRTRNSRDYDAG